MTDAHFGDGSQCQHRLVFSAFGVTLGLQSNDEQLLHRSLEALPPGYVPSGGDDIREWYTLLRSHPDAPGAPRHRLSSGSQVLAEGVRVTPVLETLEDALRLQVASLTLTHVFVHAGVVRAPGGVIVLPGRSASGKTTLVRALVAAGAEYWSDEYAAFDEAGRVCSYPRRLSIRQGTHRRHRESVEDPRGAAAPQPMGLLVVTSYVAGAAWQPVSLSAGDAAMKLFNHTLAARIRPALALRVLARAVESAVALAGARGEAASFAAELLGTPSYFRHPNRHLP